MKYRTGLVVILCVVTACDAALFVINKPNIFNGLTALLAGLNLGLWLSTWVQERWDV